MDLSFLAHSPTLALLNSEQRARQQERSLHGENIRDRFHISNNLQHLVHDLLPHLRERLIVLRKARSSSSALRAPAKGRWDTEREGYINSVVHNAVNEISSKHGNVQPSQASTSAGAKETRPYRVAKHGIDEVRAIEDIAQRITGKRSEGELNPTRSKDAWRTGEDVEMDG